MSCADDSIGRRKTEHCLKQTSRSKLTPIIRSCLATFSFDHLLQTSTLVAKAFGWGRSLLREHRRKRRSSVYQTIHQPFRYNSKIAISSIRYGTFELNERIEMGLNRIIRSCLNTRIRDAESYSSWHTILSEFLDPWRCESRLRARDVKAEPDYEVEECRGTRSSNVGCCCR